MVGNVKGRLFRLTRPRPNALILLLCFISLGALILAVTILSDLLDKEVDEKNSAFQVVSTLNKLNGHEALPPLQPLTQRHRNTAEYKLSRVIPVFALIFSIIALGNTILMLILKQAHYVTASILMADVKNKRKTYDLILCNESETGVLVYSIYMKNGLTNQYDPIPHTEHARKLTTLEPLTLSLTNKQSKLYEKAPNKVSFWLSTNVGKIKCIEQSAPWDPTTTPRWKFWNNN
ncbi:hypothetical protein VCHA35P150_310025 [Vibrio chagasii]|nr:hypothetical protein VCHA35P150_310025 [Vibrio chagasii]